MSNLRDVAEHAGVSISTASRILDNKGRTSAANREAVLAAAKLLNYRPNALAKSLKSGATHMIALIIPDIQNPYLPQIVRGAEDEARSNGYCMILCNTDESINVEQECISVLRNRWIDGIIVSSMQQNSDHLRALLDDSFPLVLIARFFGDNFDAVGIDNAAAVYNAIQYLHQLGNRRIAIALGNTALNVYADRFAGYQHAIKDIGQPYDEQYILREKDGPESIIEQTVKLCSSENCPDAVLATNDTKALAVMRGLSICGKHIPEDVAVMGIDDIFFDKLVSPSLTTIHQPLYEIGKKAVQKLLAQIEANRNGQEYIRSIELLRTTIIERESTRRR